MLSDKIKEIKLLMQYAVPPEEREQALALLEKYDGDRIALNLFHSFYSYLPEGLDDAISAVHVLARKEGLFLLCAVTGINNYLYMVSQEDAEFLGSSAEGIWDSDVRDFFGYRDQEESAKELADISSFSPYTPAHADEELCPVCSAADGELHALGCPVEVCPWCDGQLTRCNCRFTITGKSKLHTEADLLPLQEELHKKGRVPYDAKRQRPAYPEDIES
ncbi:MAG: hypothetical protein BM485_02805 [Desulfobulbaceae bacterium DB1]|nr:MAG: hypothetical protein BM485_02805 [Desulfobulbaceae bacterium DB1]